MTISNTMVLPDSKFDISIKAEKFVEKINNTKLEMIKEEIPQLETDELNVSSLKENFKVSKTGKQDNESNIEFLKVSNKISNTFVSSKPNLDNMSFKEMVNVFKDIKNIKPESEEAKKIQKIIDSYDENISLIDESPAGGEAQRNHVKAIDLKINEITKQLSENDNFMPEIKSLLTNQLDTLKSKKEYIEMQISNNPTSMKEIGNAKKIWVQSAINLIDDKIKANPNMNQTALKSLIDAKAMLLQRREEFAQIKDDTIITGKDAIKDLMGNKKAGFFAKKGAVDKTKTEMKDGNIRLFSKNLPEQEILKLVLKDAFKKAGIEPGELKEQLHKKHIDVLNNMDWKPIQKDVKISMGNGKLETFKSTITPAGHIGGDNSKTFSDYNGKGISCATSWEKEKAVNLASTEFKDSKGNVLFKALRHGINSAFGIKDKTERETANLNRSKEIIKASVVSDPVKLEKAIKEGKIEINLNSISLVTPDELRPIGNLFKKGIKKDNEKAMLNEQLEAWKKLDGKENTIKVKDKNGKEHEIKVKTNILAFNFGVNQGGVGKLSSIIGGWGNSDITNSQSMNKLFGLSNKQLKDALAANEMMKQLDETGFGSGNMSDKEYEENKASLMKKAPVFKDFGGVVGNKLKELDSKLKTATKEEAIQIKQKMDTIEQLSNQIKEIWDNKSYKKSGGDPYKMVARIAVLTNYLDDTVAFNCKSGKDRTGELDVEAKFLSLMINKNNGKVPPYNKKLTDDEKKIFREIALNGGNLEMQKYNVSAGGFKLEGVDAITERLGGKDAKEVHRGLSKHFES